MLTWLIIDEGLIMYLLPRPEQTAAAVAIHYAFCFEIFYFSFLQF